MVVCTVGLGSGSVGLRGEAGLAGTPQAIAVVHVAGFVGWCWWAVAIAGWRVPTVLDRSWSVAVICVAL